MKSIAYILNRPGSIHELELTEVEIPPLNDNEVLIESRAIGLNPVDTQARANEELLNMIVGPSRPVVLGWDISGEVIRIGNHVTKFKPGDRVFGTVNFPGHGKGYAKHVAACEDHLSILPSHASYEYGAATGLAALIALQSLQHSVSSGDHVLIHAGSGGVGHFAIQIAKSLGAYVVSTNSYANADFVKSLGADEYINYKDDTLYEKVSDSDFVLDTLGGDILINSLKCVKDAGKVVSIRSPQLPQEAITYAESHGIDLSFRMIQSNGEDTHTLKTLLEKEALIPHISKTFSFEELRRAHQEIEAGHSIGKIVIKI